jgi:ADP-heptose:LPS heptosyltransferase
VGAAPGASTAVIPAGVTLAIHPGALGDVVLDIPALRALRTQRPECRLVLAAQPRLGRLLRALGLVDRTIDFESLGLGSLFTAEPDHVGLSDLARARRVICWFGSRDPRFVDNLCALAPGAVVAPPSADDLPVWQHLRRTARAPFEGQTETVPVPQAGIAAGRQALGAAGWDGVTPYVVLQPGAGSTAKRWPVAGFAAVARALREVRALAVVVHRGPADAAPAAALAAGIGHEAILLEEPPLLTLAGALAGATLYLGNDSGVSHLAAAVGAPSVVLYTRALLAWRPWAPAAQVLVVSTEEAVAPEVEAIIDSARAAMA